MKKVELTIDISASTEKIISAFTDPQMLHDWWGVERALIDKRPGGPYTLAWNISDKGFGFVSTGLIREYQPGRMLVVDNLVYLNPGKPFFGPMTLTVRAEDKSGVSALYLCQDGYRQGEDWDWYYEAVEAAWPLAVHDLKNYLESLQE